MRILFCGDRNWFKKSYIKEALSWFSPKYDIIIHGAANGADYLAGEIAESMGWPTDRILSFPAEWNKFGKDAGRIRNAQMLREGKPDLVLAFHDDICRPRCGTRNMINQSKIAGVPVLLYE